MRGWLKDNSATLFMYHASIPVAIIQKVPYLYEDKTTLPINSKRGVKEHWY